MKYIFTNFLIAIMILSTVSGAFPVLVKAQTEVLTNEQVLHDEGVENSENEVVILKEENEESPKEIVSDEVVNEETLNTDEGVKNEEISESEKDEGEYDYNKDDESKEDNGEQGGDEENNEDEVHSTYCLEGGDMSVEEVARAYSDGLLSFDLATSTGTRFAIFSVTNNTNCTLPISLSSYKMFDNVLSHQEFYAGTGLVHATSSTSIRVELPLCTAQVDAWYGLHPKYLLDSNPYGYPNVPMVIKYGYVNVSNLCKHEVENTPPVITLVGANPINVNVGDDFTDPGATALDLEDGDITSNIVAQNNVDTNITGTYTITYNVVDSGGLHAQEVLRTVNVLNVEHGSNGTITFCLAIIADSQNVLATSSTNLPSGLFTINLATSTNFASSTVNSKTWSTSTFSPNNKVILSENDVDCVSFTDLELGTYNYSQLSVSGSLWKEPKYNDQDLQPVNNVFDFFLFDDNNSSSDGKIVIDESRRERTIYLLDSYKPAPQCDLPVITSPLTASGVVGTQFTYNLTASSTTDILSVSTSTLPAWLSFATSTNILSGVPTDAGTFNIGMSASNDCGLDSQILVLTITSGGGGGGGPTADLDILKSSDKTVVDVGDTVTYTITATNHGPNDATNVSLTDLLPSTLTFVSSTSTVGSYATSTGIWTIGDLANNATSSLTIVATINSDTYGQTITNTATASSTVSDPDSGNNASSVDVKVNPAPVTGCTTNCGGGGGGGGGNGPIVGSLTSTGGSIVVPPTPNSCYYLFDYLRKDFNNNPIEVKKLQVFLRDLEGFSTVEITGVYDNQTIVALNAFQDRYKDDILTPWGHTAPTSYTYILTKKKVNEIYCKTAFPVTVQQQEEIDAYRNFLQGLRDSGIDLSGTGTLPVDNSNNTVTPEFIDKVVNGEVGVNDTDNAGNQATLAGYSSSTRNIVSNLTANVISSGKRLVNFLLGLFAWPFGKTNSDDAVQCVDDSYLGIGWLNVILILIIIVISYLWYREYRNNKRIEELNKVIDLE